ncbi:MAG: hypothetical protein V4556_01325 [Bacteroidota bacterium]
MFFYLTIVVILLNGITTFAALTMVIAEVAMVFAASTFVIVGVIVF